MSGAGSAPRKAYGSGDQTLPRSIFVPQEDPRKDGRETVDTLLSDRFMAFLSILLLPIILIPLFVGLTSYETSFFDICDATIVVFFVVEYVSKLYFAKSRWEFFTSPWHIVDLVVVVLSFLGYLPLVILQGHGSTTLLLRLLRLPRAIAVGGRTAGSRIRTEQTSQAAMVQQPQTVIRQVGADLAAEQDNLTWADVEKHLSTKEQEWIDIHNITEDGIVRLSNLLQVAPRHFKVDRIDEVYPHIDYVQHMSFIFLQSGQIQYPERSEHFLTISRLGETVICWGPKVISASPHGTDMFERSLAEIRTIRGEHSFTVSVLYGILDATLKEYKSLFSEIEYEISIIGSTPRSRLPKDFLRRMYELNKQVVRLVSNLVHFRELLGVTVSRRVPIEGFDEGAREAFQRLQEETAYMNDIADDIVGNLRTLIDLYINQSSFETNRILKILAVISVLAIIPAVLTGLLGTNLLGQPYRLDLWQLVMVVLIAMSFVGYCFVKLGWLKN